MITVEKGDGGIVVKFPYNKDYIEKIKTINEHRWNVQEKYWYFPDDNGVVKKILLKLNNSPLFITLEFILLIIQENFTKIKFHPKEVYKTFLSG